jgi:DnaK suppressor protein
VPHLPVAFATRCALTPRALAPTLDFMLTPEQAAELRARLEAEHSRLVANAHSALDFTMDRDRDRIGRDSMDESTEEELYSTQLRLHDRETNLIAKISEALRRLEGGEIDKCEECFEPIGFKRLMARPVTTLCFECKTAREQVEADDAAE